MIVEEVVWPGIVPVEGVPILYLFAICPRTEWGIAEGIIKAGMQPVWSNVGASTCRVDQEGFAHNITVRVTIHDFADILHNLDHLGLIGVVKMVKCIKLAQ